MCSGHAAQLAPAAHVARRFEFLTHPPARRRRHPGEVNGAAAHARVDAVKGGHQSLAARPWWWGKQVALDLAGAG